MLNKYCSQRRPWLALLASGLPLLSGCPASKTAQNTITTMPPQVTLTQAPTIMAKDVATAPLPDQPVAGTFNGQKFTPNTVQIQTGVSQMTSPTGNRVVQEITQYHITFRQGSQYPNIQDVQVHINLKGGEKLPGRSFAVHPGTSNSETWRKQFQYSKTTGGTPLGVVGISVNARPEGAQMSQPAYYSEKYSLRLHFGQPQGGKLPGQINLYLPDMEKSYIAGSFMVAPEPYEPEPPWNGPAASVVPADISNVPLPSGPATGMLYGQKFVVQKAEVISNGALVLSQGNGPLPERSVTIYFFMDDKRKLAGKTYQVKPQVPLGTLVPHINVDWMVKSPGAAPIQKRLMFLNKYSMRLKFGPLQNNKISAQINLRLPDKLKSYVAGKFTVDVKNP